MKLGDLLGAYQTNLPITPRHEAWLLANPNASYTDLAKEFLGREVGKPQRDRTKTFSASGAGSCPRKRQFAYIGIPEARTLNSRTISIFHNGTWTHLRWQLAGLSAGWLAMAEVSVHYDDLMLTGTLDGITDTGWGLEIKSINSQGFNRVMTYGAKAEHKAQADAYLLMTDLPGFSFIYENKDTQDYKEIVYPRNEEWITKAHEAQKTLADMTAHRVLAPEKPACIEKTGPEYNYCPFKKICPLVKSWEHAEEIKETACASAGRTLRLRRTSSTPTS